MRKYSNSIQSYVTWTSLRGHEEHGIRIRATCSGGLTLHSQALSYNWPPAKHSKFKEEKHLKITNISGPARRWHLAERRSHRLMVSTRPACKKRKKDITISYRIVSDVFEFREAVAPSCHVIFVCICVFLFAIRVR